MAKTIELTDKKWKVFSLISCLLMIMGIGCCGMSNMNTGVVLFAIGAILMIVSKTGKWWTNE